MTIDKHQINLGCLKLDKACIHLNNIVLNGDKTSKIAAEEAIKTLNEAQFKIRQATNP